MPATVVARFVRLNSRCLRSGSSTTGARCQEQRLTNSAASATDAANAPMIFGDAHPQLLPWTMPRVSSASDNARISAPARSGRVRRPGERLSTSLRPASTTTSAPIGTFTRKQRRQSERWINVPPIGGPSAAAMAADEPYTVSARARRPAGNAFTTSASDAGTTIAPPSAWSARAPIRKPALGAIAQRALAVVNSTTPTWNMRLRPSRSASRPEPTRNAANTMLYASKIQLSVVSVTPLKSARIDGNAMFTIVESTNSMNTPSDAIASTVDGFTALRVTRAAVEACVRGRAVPPNGAGAVSSHAIADAPRRCGVALSSSAWRVLASPRGGSAVVAQVALERLLDREDALRVAVPVSERLKEGDAALVEDPQLGRPAPRAARGVGLDLLEVSLLEHAVPLARLHVP